MSVKQQRQEYRASSEEESSVEHVVSGERSRGAFVCLVQRGRMGSRLNIFCHVCVMTKHSASVGVDQSLSTSGGGRRKKKVVQGRRELSQLILGHDDLKHMVIIMRP